MTTMTDEQETKAKETVSQIDILSLIGQTTTLTGNSELYGPCPMCGGRDRFHVKPNENVWFCSYCTGRPESGSPWSDQIEFVKRYHNLSYIDTLKYLAPTVFGESKPVTPKPMPRPAQSPAADLPPLDWQAKAFDAAVILADDLWRDENAKARAWLNGRGIDDAAIYRYSLGFTKGGDVNGIEFKIGRGIVIPHWSQRYRTMFALKVRRAIRPGTPNKYYCATGSRPATSLFNADSLIGQSICFVTEGELDALALHSKISDLAAVVTLGSKGAKLADRWLPDLYHVRRFIIVTDCGEDEAAANYWLSLVGKRARRFILPGNAKDICEAAEGGLDLRDWAIAVMNSIQT